MSVSYEIMTQMKGKWTSDSIANEKSDAVSRAEEAFSRGKVTAVKVIEEKFDEGSGESRERIVFNRVRKTPPTKKKKKKEEDTEEEEKPRKGKKKPRRSLSDLLIIMSLGIISVISTVGLVVCVLSR